MRKPPTFRPQAIEHQRRRLAGEIVVSAGRPLGVLLLAYGLAIAVAAAALWNIRVPVAPDGARADSCHRLAAAAGVAEGCRTAGSLPVRPALLVFERVRSTLQGETKPRKAET